MRTFVFTVFLVLFGQQSMAQNASGQQIMLVDALDEPEFYCFDLTGFGDHLALEDPIQAHSCKLPERGPDQMFSFDGDQIQVVGYDRCLQASGTGDTTLPGASILARECSDTAKVQRFELDDSGKLYVKDTGFCIGVSASSTPARGPSHLWRALFVMECDGDESLSTWQIGLN